MPSRTWIFVLALILGHLGFDASLPALSHLGQGNELLDAFLIGWCIGQLNLIAIWSALAPGKVVVRIPWTLLLATLLWYALILGWRAVDPIARIGSDALVLGGLLLFGVLVTQFPLWIANLGYQWRLIPPGTDAEALASSDHQFNTRQLLLGVVAVSLALGIGRVVVRVESWPADMLDGAMFVVLFVLAACNLIVTAPCIWMAFLPQALLAAGTIGWVIYALVVSIGEVVVLTMMLGPPPGAADFILVAWFLNLAQCGVVFGTMMLLRASGFQLIRVVDVSRQAMDE